MSNDPAARLAALEDIEAIKRLKASYFRLVDAKRWPEVKSLFSPDAEIAATAGESGSVEGFVASLEALTAGVTTFHAGHMPEIDLWSAGRARGRWAMTFHMQWEQEGVVRGRQGYRLYEDEYTRSESDGRWRISRMQITAIPADPLAVRPA